MDNNTLVLVTCIAALGASAYIVYRCSQKDKKEHYHQPRYCPQGKAWCDYAHTCVPFGKCHH